MFAKACLSEDLAKIRWYRKRKKKFAKLNADNWDRLGSVNSSSGYGFVQLMGVELLENYWWDAQLVKVIQDIRVIRLSGSTATTIVAMLSQAKTYVYSGNPGKRDSMNSQKGISNVCAAWS